MKIYGLTDKGTQREYNEDSIGIFSESGISVCVVCDGMGGAVGGKVASELAKNTFLEYVREEIKEKKGSVSQKDAKEILKYAIDTANRKVTERAEENPSLDGMGCTLCAVMYLCKTGKMLSANVGDSRLYRITQRKIEQLTKDHSYVQYLLDIGEISEEEAEDHPQKNLITRAVGIDETVDADIKNIRIPALGNTYFLLCSDGLHGMISDGEIKDIVLSDADTKEKTARLIKSANEAGGYDNISAILISVNEKNGEEQGK